MIRAEGTGELVRLPSIDVSRISFAAMGGSAEDLRGAFPENDVAYDVDSSDEDLDGMETAVGRFERRAAERESLRRAAEANEDAARRLATETRETARAVEGLRQRRRRFEEARVAAERRGKGPASVAGDGRVAGSIPGDADRPFDEERELRDLRERRRRVDERIARLLEEAAGYDREREMVAGSNPTRDDELALAVGDRERRRRLEEEDAAREDDDDDVDVDHDHAPRWKRRQEERWAREAEEVAAALERAEVASSLDGTAPESREAAGLAPPSPLVPAARSADDLAEAANAIVENRAEDFARTLAYLASLVNARDEAGDTLLHLAASLDRRRCVKTLVRAGASVGARNDAGVSVVERAIEHERFELADYLVKWCERHGVELG